MSAAIGCRAGFSFFQMNSGLWSWWKVRARRDKLNLSAESWNNISASTKRRHLSMRSVEFTDAMFISGYLNLLYSVAFHCDLVKQSCQVS